LKATKVENNGGELQTMSDLKTLAKFNNLSHKAVLSTQQKPERVPKIKYSQR
jgi:hypothetical protein